MDAVLAHVEIIAAEFAGSDKPCRCWYLHWSVLLGGRCGSNRGAMFKTKPLARLAFEAVMLMAHSSGLGLKDPGTSVVGFNAIEAGVAVARHIGASHGGWRPF
jgi:hypothetical protein